MFLDEFDHIIKISIHALREEGDQILLDAHAANNVFLSTPSARRATWNSMLGAIQDNIFLSTPSARRATKAGEPVTIPMSDFYPRPPRGGRHWSG